MVFNKHNRLSEPNGDNAVNPVLLIFTVNVKLKSLGRFSIAKLFHMHQQCNNLNQ